VPAVPPLPEPLEYLWRWFRELSGFRGATGFGPARLTPLDILGHAILTQRWPAPWELQALNLLDMHCLALRAPGDLDDPPPALREERDG